MNISFAHIIHDEKFPDSAYDLFEEIAPGCSDYFMFGKDKELENLKRIRPVRLSKYAYLSNSFARRLEKYDAVLLHGLSAPKLEVLARASKKVCFVWVGMGFDYYDIIFDDPSALLKEKTRRLCAHLASNHIDRPSSLWHHFKHIIRPFVLRSASNKKQLIEKINWFAPVLDLEYDLVKEKKKWVAFPEFIDWNYGNGSQVFDKLADTWCVSSGSILLGNSATPTNNHVDAFDLIQNLGVLNKRKIVAPLSYGQPRYREQVIKEGRQRFGKSFMGVTDFMPLADYTALLATCSTVIMNQKRQQAGGALQMTLYLGCRVFLDKQNPLYDFYRKHGVMVNSLDELRSQPHLLNSPLTHDEAKINRTRVEALHGHQVLIDKTHNLIETVTGKLLAPNSQTSVETSGT